MAKLRSWSFSRWLVYEPSQGGCPLRAKLRYVDKLPEPQGPAAARGEEIHKMAQDFVEGKLVVVPAPLRAHSFELRALKKEQPRPLCEEELAFTEGFGELTDWRSGWCRMKLDVVSLADALTVIDYKTGRVYVDKHRLQGELYALGALKAYDKKRVTVKFWYTDQGPLANTQYFYGSGEQSLPKLVARWNKRVAPMLKDTRFKATPSTAACKWCPFGVSRGGPCRKEVR